MNLLVGFVIGFALFIFADLALDWLTASSASPRENSLSHRRTIPHRASGQSPFRHPHQPRDADTVLAELQGLVDSMRPTRRIRLISPIDLKKLPRR